MINKILEVEKFLKKKFPDGIQMFNTHGIFGDSMFRIYQKDCIEVDYCEDFNYIEIFGITQEEFEYLRENCEK